MSEANLKPFANLHGRKDIAEHNEAVLWAKSEITRLRAELDQARAACAEVREAMQIVRNWIRIDALDAANPSHPIVTLDRVIAAADPGAGKQEGER